MINWNYQFTTDALKTTSKRPIQTAEATLI